MVNTKQLAVLNTLFFLVHLVPSQLSQLKVFNNQTIGDVSDKYPALFTPAGVTFSIWGVIYLALSSFCIYHLVKAFKGPHGHQANRDLRRMGYLFMLNNLATGLWTVAWVHEWLVLSMLLICTQLATLLAMHVRLGIFDAGRPAASRWLTQMPLSLYLGWIIIATVANVSSALVGLGWDGLHLSPGTWATAMVLVATGIVVSVTLARSNLSIGLVGVWALYGIVLRHQSLGREASPQITAAAWVGMALLVLATLAVLLRNKKRQSGFPKQTRSGVY